MLVGRGAMIPKSSRFVIVGAGIHGLSTAYHLAQRLAAVQTLSFSTSLEFVPGLPVLPVELFATIIINRLCGS